MMKKILQNIFTIIFILVSIQIDTAYTFDCDTRNVDPELLCLVSSSYYERKYNIPKHLLRSISIVESGKWNSEYKMTFAWPWVVGIDGKGEYFKSYNEAAVFLRKAIARGANVDIGCHQINWKYHGHNFNKPEDLLHPKINAAYAAHFLVEKFNASKNWSKAVAHYHSSTPQFSDRYLKKVHNILENMKGKDGMRYSEYMKNATSNISKNHNILYSAKNLIKKSIIRNKDTTVLDGHIKSKKQNINEISDMMVFSVELPANSSILGN